MERTLPVGRLRLRVSRLDPFLEGLTFDRIVPADDYLVRGLSRRDRAPGLGAPLIAVLSAPPAGSARASAIISHPKIPVTALLRLDEGSCELKGTELTGALELYTPFSVQEVRIGDQAVPLESDLTAVIAYALEGAQVWKTEMAGLLSARQEIKSGLYTLGPYKPGKIPVVFVHGTASNPGRWAEMFNTLYADPVLRQRYQFWYFIYTTGNPILYSASILRESLRDLVQTIDPEGTDSALKQMVVIGHSQGGLLTRILASSNSESWGGVPLAQLETMKLKEKDRELLRRCLVFEPSPYVRRVVFISTPHRGSFRVSNFVQWLAQRFIELPWNMLRTGRGGLQAALPRPLPKALRKGVPTSIENMKPGSPFAESFSALPRSPEIKAHSIISVKPGGAIEQGTDGVVAYTSAHLDDVESEFVVRCSHSCQAHPSVIEEVRRILLLHVNDLSAAAVNAVESFRSNARESADETNQHKISLRIPCASCRK